MKKSIIALVKMLIGISENRMLSWESTSTTEVYKSQFQKGFVTIGKSVIPKSFGISAQLFTPDSMKTSYDFAIYNERGDRIYKTSVEDSEEQSELFAALHESARASYYKLDDTLDGLIGEIEKIAKTGKGNEVDIDKEDM